MTNPSRKFFDEINRLRHDRLLEKAVGTLRIDLTEGSVIENWFITVDKGNISATNNGMRPADAVLRTDRTTFEQVASGQMNATAAIARGQISARGDSRLLIQFLRLFPARPGTPGRRLVATGGRRQL